MSDLRRAIDEFVRLKNQTISRADTVAGKLEEIIRTVIPDVHVFLRSVIFEFSIAAESRINDIDHDEKIIPVENVLNAAISDCKLYFDSHIFLTDDEAEKLEEAFREEYAIEKQV